MKLTMRPKLVGKTLLIAFLGYLFLTTIINLFRLTDLDIYQINVRRGYYPLLIGKIFQNKLTYSFLLSRNSFFKLIHD